MRFRLMRVRSPLLAQSLLFSFPPGTEMFQFSGCPLPALCVQAGVPCIAWRVSPFGYLRVKGCLRLTGASRRLLRPSSAPCPKASTVRPYQLEHHTHCTTPMQNMEEGRSIHSTDNQVQQTIKSNRQSSPTDNQAHSQQSPQAEARRPFNTHNPRHTRSTKLANFAEVQLRSNNTVTSIGGLIVNK